MKEWLGLYRQHGELRIDGRSAVSEIRQVLKRFGESRGSIFAPHIASRLQQLNNKRNGNQEFRFADEHGEPLLLKNHPDWHETGHRRIHLDEVCLHVYVVVNRRDNIQEVNLMVKGKRRDAEGTLAIAVHLPDDQITDKTDGDRQGIGACGHAAFHCHIGPTLDAQPKLRVPLPPLRPARALEWMLSQVVPAYEAAPWPAVKSALKAPVTSSA
jgi:hypothetical protein